MKTHVAMMYLDPTLEPPSRCDDFPVANNPDVKVYIYTCVKFPSGGIILSSEINPLFIKTGFHENNSKS